MYGTCNYTHLEHHNGEREGSIRVGGVHPKLHYAYGERNRKEQGLVILYIASVSVCMFRIM